MNAYSDLDKLNLPVGFEISIFAKDLDSPRQITQTDEGYVIVGSKKGDKIYALHDQDLDGYAEKRILIADGLQNPTGVSVFEGDLYFECLGLVPADTDFSLVNKRRSQVKDDFLFQRNILRIVGMGNIKMKRLLLAPISYRQMAIKY